MFVNVKLTVFMVIYHISLADISFLYTRMNTNIVKESDGYVDNELATT